MNIRALILGVGAAMALLTLGAFSATAGPPISASGLIHYTQNDPMLLPGLAGSTMTLDDSNYVGHLGDVAILFRSMPDEPGPDDEPGDGDGSGGNGGDDEGGDSLLHFMKEAPALPSFFG